MATPKRDVGMFNYEPPSFSPPRTQPMEVIIVGLSRTGTSWVRAWDMVGECAEMGKDLREIAIVSARSGTERNEEKKPRC